MDLYHTDCTGLNFTDKEIASFRNARIGTYLVVPLRTLTKPISNFSIEECINQLGASKWTPYDWHYDDLYNHINQIFCFDNNKKNKRYTRKDNKVTIGINFKMNITDALAYFSMEQLVLDEHTEFFVYNNGGENGSFHDSQKNRFRFRCFQVIIMHSGVGFLIIGIESSTPIVYDELLRSGYNDNRTMLGIHGHPKIVLSIGDLISRMLLDINMTDYSMCIENKQMGNLFRDTTIYSVVVLPDYVQGDTTAEISDKLYALCLNMRQAQTLGSPTFKNPDPSISFFSHASVSCFNGKQVIRWGLYTIFEHTTQIIVDKRSGNLDKGKSMAIDPINIYGEKREDNYLPFILFVLYERYSYLMFTELLRRSVLSTDKDRQWLKLQMLRLKAFGTILPGDMSPYSNVNVFFKEQCEIYDISDMLNLIDNKINIVTHAKEEEQERRNSLLERFLTIFGVISILCDSIGLLELLLPDSLHHNLFAIVCMVEMIIFCATLGVLQFRKRRRK